GVEHAFFGTTFGLEIDGVASFRSVGRVLGCDDVVADFAFQATVGYKALEGLGIDAREVAGVGIAVGITVGDVEEIEEVVAILDGFGHGRSELKMDDVDGNQTVSAVSVSASGFWRRVRVR